MVLLNDGAIGQPQDHQLRRANIISTRIKRASWQGPSYAAVAEVEEDDWCGPQEAVAGQDRISATKVPALRQLPMGRWRCRSFLAYDR